MGTFKEDSRISASNITRLWVAEGFIKPKGTRVLEDIAEDILKDLSDRNLVLGVEHRHTGKIKSFSIHDLLRDLCIKVAEQHEFFHVKKLNTSPGRIVRRLICQPYEDETGVALACSIFGWNYYVEYVTSKLLRVFDATRNKSPEDIYVNNVNLCYLVHKRLSSNLCLVWSLQTLIIQGNYDLVMVPLGIWKMRQLRHVKCLSLYLPPPPPMNRQNCMENLQTLKRVMNLRLSQETCEMIPNIKKLHLLYDAKMKGYDDNLIECLRNLNRFRKLESLGMRITFNKWPYGDPKLGSKLAFPHSLKKLWLEECCWEDMSVIGSLPQLQLLHLKWKAVTKGRVWSPVGGQFLGLKFLKIDGCGLHSWDADSSHFPVLEKLILCYLSLEEIPLEIGEIPSLGLIHVDRCRESAAISAMKIKKDQLENYDNDALQIEIYVSDSEMESFKKRAETEELPLSLLNLSNL